MEGILSFQQLQPNNLLKEAIEYIEQQLPDFVGSNTFDKIMVIKKNEDQHTNAFCVFLSKPKQDKFTFIPQVAQKGSRKIDIAIYNKASDDIIFTIEAKVLPTPPGNKNFPRAQSEYVFSNKGEAGAAMQRFREGLHGLDDNEIYLSENGIIAYIKEDDFELWLSKINQWVSDAAWGKSEQLKKVYFESTGKLISKHTRNGFPLTLHHFWVKVVK